MYTKVELRKELRLAHRQIRRLHAAATAYQDLSTRYRLSRTPSEGLFKRLESARKAMDDPMLADILT